MHSGDTVLDNPVDFALNLVKLNCSGPVQVAHHFGTRMVEQGRGGLLFVGSMSGVCGATGTACVRGVEGVRCRCGPRASWSELR